jgi:hypothetical protein
MLHLSSTFDLPSLSSFPTEDVARRRTLSA